MSTNLITTQINQLAERFDLPQSEELYQVLKATAFKGNVTDAQLSALLIVAKQYGLNPWTKEIYAFPDGGGIVPVVGVDGWSRIINSNPQHDGMDFEWDDDSCTCVIYRKDRSHPTKVTEYMSECKRPDVKPWKSHPKRMLRHKAMIQCARMAYGFGGIYDLDEAERIIEAPPEKHLGMADVVQTAEKPVLPGYTDEQFKINMTIWRKVIASGKKKVDEVLATVETMFTLTDDQVAAIKAIPAELVKAAGERKPEGRTGPGEAPTVTYAQCAEALNKATDMDKLNDAATLLNAIENADQQRELNAMYDQRAKALNQ
jgi:phage recombination protein Bet